MSDAAQPSGLLAPIDASAVPAVRTGGELAALGEALYMRLFVIALGGMELVCPLVIAAALVRTRNADFSRTATLALVLALLVAPLLRAPARGYHAMRLRPWVSLAPPALVLAAFVLDGVSHSPLSFAAAVSIAFPAFVCGRRWALTAAALISAGSITAATLRTGWGALNSVGQGTVAYFVWALVLSGLAESFARLMMQMPDPGPTPAPTSAPIRVPNLAGDPRPAAPDPAQPRRPTAAVRPHRGRLTARQLQVVALLADGLRAEQVADRLGISTSTVYRYVERAKQRTGMSTLAQLIALAAQESSLPAADGPQPEPPSHA